jgi:hypothetical protein
MLLTEIASSCIRSGSALLGLVALAALTGCSAETDVVDEPPVEIVGLGGVSGRILGPNSGAMVAVFAYASDEPECSILEEEGACQLVLCDTPYTDPRPGPFPDAGVITVTAAGSFTLTPDSSGDYDGESSATPVFEAGAPIHAEAAGGEVPAFALDAVAPSPLTLVAPDLGTVPSLDRTEPLTVGWEGASAGEAITSVMASYQLTSGGRARGVVCRAPADAGEVVMPADLLGELGTGDATFFLGSLVVAPTTIEGWQLALSVELVGLQPSHGGGFADGLVTLE